MNNPPAAYLTGYAATGEEMKRDKKFEAAATVVILSGIAYFAAHIFAAIWAA